MILATPVTTSCWLTSSSWRSSPSSYSRWSTACSIRPSLGAPLPTRGPTTGRSVTRTLPWYLWASLLSLSSAISSGSSLIFMRLKKNYSKNIFHTMCFRCVILQYMGILRKTGQNGEFIGFNMSRFPIFFDLGVPWCRTFLIFSWSWTQA